MLDFTLNAFLCVLLVLLGAALTYSHMKKKEIERYVLADIEKNTAQHNSTLDILTVNIAALGVAMAVFEVRAKLVAYLTDKVASNEIQPKVVLGVLEQLDTIDTPLEELSNAINEADKRGKKDETTGDN